MSHRTTNATTRRDFLRIGAVSGTAAAALLAIPRPLLAMVDGRPEPVPPIQDPRLQELAARALDAARAAGASYADVRLTHTHTRLFAGTHVHPGESMEVGVRALVNGYWGFASSPIWSPDEMARLGRSAAQMATIAPLGEGRRTELVPVTARAAGHWETPIEIDPFALHPHEVADYLAALTRFVRRTPRADVVRVSVRFESQEKALATTDGAWVTQRTTLGSGILAFVLTNADRTAKTGRDLGDTIFTPQGRGWEMFRAADARGDIRRLIEEMRAELALPTKPVEVGRYGAVLDAVSVARLLDATLGRATELDRAMGYEANAGGTSYIDRPLEMVGSYEAAAKIVNVRADRDDVGAAATVGWDDEGVPAGRFDLVRDGVLVDFQTTREGAAWLGEYYGKQGMERASRGCAAAPTAVEAPMTHTANLALAPGASAGGFDELLRSLGDGVAIRRAGFDLDWQASSGVGEGTVLEVKGGRPVARLVGAGMLFRATDLWKSVRALGGADSAARLGIGARKGEPAQERVHSVTAVPALLEGLTIIDPQRKA